MKAVKLIAIFLLILGIVVGAFFLFSKNGVIPGGGGGKGNYSEISKEIKQEWQECSGDDANKINALCKQNYNLLEQYENNNSINSDESTRLKHSNSLLAIEKVNEGIFEEWEEDNCKKSVIDTYYDVIKTVLAKDNEAKKDEKLKKICAVYDVYKKAYLLAHLRTEGHDYDWDAFRQVKKNEIQRVRANSYYKEYLSHINDLKNGLKTTERKLSVPKKNTQQKTSRHSRNR